MTVRELIKLLETCEGTKPVKIFINWDDRPEVSALANNEGHVLLGNDMPAEVYERDYKYERS